MRLSGHKKVDSLDECHKVVSVKKLDVRTEKLKSACLEYSTSAPNELKSCIFGQTAVFVGESTAVVAGTEL